MKSKKIPLILQLEDFKEFWTLELSHDRLTPPLREDTVKTYINRIKLLLGVLHRYREPKIPLEKLQLQCLIPSNGKTEQGALPVRDVLDSLNEIFFILNYLKKQRKANSRYRAAFLAALITVAKYLYHDDSENRFYFRKKSSRSIMYSDIPVIVALRDWQTLLLDEAKNAPLVADESKKWIDWMDFLATVEQLRQECSVLDKNGERRSDRAIAASIQRFLIVAMFAAFPDRSRTFRELEEGVTLVKNGLQWQVEHTAAQLKVPRFAAGGKRIVPLPDWFYRELEAWLHGYEDETGNWQGWVDEQGNRKGWRSFFNPTHNFVFTQLNGKPYHPTTFHKMFRGTMYRLTGQACNPHLVRSMIITALMQEGVPDFMMQALAYLMAHSYQTQQNIYDRRTPQEKMKPALDKLHSMLPNVNSALPPKRDP